MKKKTLVIYGSLGAGELGHHVKDWSNAQVVEMDAILPAEILQQGPGVVPSAPVMDHARAADIQRRVNALIGELLQERAGTPGLETGREFRAACISIECFMMLSPYLYNLDIARRLASAGPWDKIVVSPGGGVSVPAWRQMAEYCGVPLHVLPDKGSSPPLWWMLKRRLQKKWASRGRKMTVRAASLPPANEKSGWVCGDPRLNGLLSGDDGHWAAVPPWSPPAKDELELLRASYNAWWEAWWNAWLAEHPSEDKLSERWILNTLGRFLCQNIHPLHAVFLQQARAVLKDWSPHFLLIGAMRGKPEIMWMIAARERGILTGAYTLDDSVDPDTSFRPDFAFCDDARHRDLALGRMLPPERVVMVKSHRAATQRDGRARLEAGGRARIVLADTFFSGWKMAILPSLSLWVYRLVVETARLLPEHDFIIKFHPLRERPVEHLSWGGFHNQQLWHREQYIKGLHPPANVSLSAPEQRMTALLDTAHLLLNIESYAAFEAYSLNVPVIHVAATEHEPAAYARLIAMGAAQVVDQQDPARLAALIQQNLFDEHHIARQTGLQRDFIHEFYCGRGLELGDAARRAACRRE